NNKCTVNAKVFRTSLDICPRVEGVDFTDVRKDDTALTFLIDLGYKGPLYKHTNLFVDHMHQPWRTLAAIINKWLSGKTVSNDKLKKSRIDILCGMFKKENVDYPELIWEDLAYQTDHRKEKRSRRENMPYPRFTKIIINRFLKQYKSLINLNCQHYHTIKDDGIVSRLKFVRIGEDYQEYGLPIPETMLTEAIKQFESYQMFIKYSTGQIRPKKSRGKGSQGKKTADNSQETVDVFEESEPVPEPAKKKTSSKRRVKKKVTLYADNNIISDDLDATLELAKSISQSKAEEAEAARKVHATHARIVTKSVLKSAKKKSSGKSSRCVIIQDTSSAPKLKPATSKTKLKGAPSLTPTKQEAVDIMQALKENEQDNEHSDDNNDDVEKDDKDGDVDDKGNDYISDTQDVDDEDVKTESDEEDIYKYKIHVCKDEDKEMINAKVDDSDRGDEEITDAAKADAKNTSEAKDDAKKIELPPSSSSLSVSLGFGDQFLKLSSDSSLVSTVKDTTDSEINSLLEVKIQSEVPHTQSPSMLSVPVSVISEPIIPIPVQESPSTATATTLPPPFLSTSSSIPQQTTTPIPTPTITTDAPTVTAVVPEYNALTAVELRVAKLEKDVSELKTIDHSIEYLAILKSQVPSVVDNYFGSKVGDKQTPTVNLEQGSEKSVSEILQIKREQAEKQHNPKFTIKSTDKATLEEYDLKSALYESMHANKSFNRNPTNHRLYYALMEALIEDKNAMDKGVADTIQDRKRKHDDDEDEDDKDSPAGPNQGKKTKRRRTKEFDSFKKPSFTKETPKGKALSKGSKTGKSTLTKEPVEEPSVEVVMDDADWFKQPPRPPTPDPEWNKCQVVLDQPAQPWFNQMVSATKDPLTFNVLMATPIDFSKYVLNGLNIENLTQDILLGHAFNLLKGTYKLNWNNPEGDHYPFDLSKPLPLQGPLGHRTDVANYFFNNDLEYLKNSDPEVNKFSKHNVYSTKAILGVKSVSVKKLHGYDPPGIVYEDLDKQKRVLRADELYKFSDGTLKSVYDEIHHRVLDFCLYYNTKMPKRKWTVVDRKRSGLMIELIDKQL
ncbi:hypothetical protein Tco_0603627, partial [Tanacetum coccineum]